MRPAPAFVAAIRRRACTRAGCAHVGTLPDICDDLDASCPAGIWSATPPGCPILVRNPGGTRSRAFPVVAATDARERVPPIAPTPREQWPAWAVFAAKFAQHEDIGLGDVIQRRIIGTAASTAFQALYKAATGSDCGCSARQVEWNARYPLRT